MPTAPRACRRSLSRLSAFAIASFLWLPVPAAAYPGLNGGPGDLDGDGFVAAADCDDGDSSVWAVPSEVQNLLVPAGNPKRFAWDPVANTGGSGVSATYEMLRSQSASNFLDHPTATCLDVNGLDRETVDPTIPPLGGVLFYLVRARASCGSGGLGARSNGVARAGRDCDCAQLCDDGNACTTDRCGNGACAHDIVAPVLLHGPASTSACTGGSARFDVVVRSSLGTLHYAWRRNGQPIGTDSNSLVLAGLVALDNGAQITVDVTDGCVTTTSPAAVLTVFANSASCAGGLSGEDAPNGAGAITIWMGAARVSLHSGELHYEAADLVIAGRGFDFVWARHYRSREWRSTRMGVGWTHSYDRRIEPDPAQPGNLFVHDADSRIDSFAPALSGCYEASGFFESLCPQLDGSHVLTFPDGSSWTFAALDGALAQGRILQSRDRYGNSMSFAYDGTGRLGAITDTLGRNIQVAYNVLGLIASVTDFAGRQVRYAYYNGVEPGGELDDLKSVASPAVTGTPTGNDFPQGKTEAYTYSQGSPIAELNHNLRSITDGAGDTWLRAAYSTTQLHADPAFDRLYRLESHDGSTTAATKFSYVTEMPGPGNGFAVTKTIVGDGVGNVGEYHFDALSRLVVVRDFTGRTPDPAVPTDDTFNRPGPPLRLTDPPYFETRNEYNADFLPTRVVLPNGNELLSTYDSSNPSKRKQGDMVMLRQLPGLLGGDQIEIVESWQCATSLGTDWSGRSDTAGGEGGGGAGGLLATGKVKVIRSTGSGVTGGSDAVRGKVKVIRSTGGGMTGGTDAVRGKIKTVKDGGNGVTGGSDAVRGKVKNIRNLGGSGGMTDGADAVRGKVKSVRDLGGGMSGGTDAVRGKVKNIRDLGGGGMTGGTDAVRGKVKIVRDNGNGMTGGSDAVRGKVKDIRDTGGSGRSLTGFPTSYTDGEGNTWTLAYDASGNLTDLTAPTVVTGTLGGMAQTIHDGWAHNAFGQIVQHTDPLGRVEGFDYYASGPQIGYLQRAIVDPAGLELTTMYEYDALGRLVRMIDPRGHGTSLTVNALDQIVRISESPDFPYEEYFYYDAADRQVRTDLRNVDETGTLRSNPYLSSLYDHDGLDRLVRATEETGPGTGVAEEYQWDPNDSLSLWRKGAAVAETQPANVVVFQHDERDLLYRVVEAAGDPADVATDQYDYDRNGNLTAESLGLEHPAGPDVTAWNHDGFDRPVHEADAEGNETIVHYDANGNVVSLRLDGELTDGSGGPNVRLYESSFVHDEIDRLVRTEVAHFEVATGLPIGDGTSTSSTFFDPASRVARAEDDNGHGADYAYDSAGRIALSTDPRGDTIAVSYDANSNPTQFTEVELSDLGSPPETFVTSFEYDALHRRTAVVDSVGERREAAFDSRDLMVRATDQLGNGSRFIYDGLGRNVRTERDLTTTGTGSGTVVSTQVTSRSFDDSSRLVSSTDPNGNTTSTQYDARDRRRAVTSADGTSRSFVWDAHGDLAGMTDANGSVVTLVNDRLGRTRTRSVVPAPGVIGSTSQSHRYDGASRLVRSQDEDTLTTFGYDSMSGLIEDAQQIGGGPVRTVRSGYDGVGNMTSMTYPSGQVVTTIYDSLDRPRFVFTGFALAASYDYAGPTRVARVTRGNGTTTDISYDGARRVLGRTDSAGAATLVQQAYTWGPACDKLSRTEAISGSTHEYQYDSLHRLVHSIETTSGAPPVPVAYQLDSAGNRLLVVGGTDAGPYTMDPTLPEPADLQMNQYTTTPRGTRTYDRDGNHLVLDGGTPSARALEHDFQSQICRVTRAGALTSYGLDALGRSVGRASSAGPAIEWTRGVMGELEQFAGGAPQWTFTYGADGLLLQMEENSDANGSGALDTYSVHADDLGNVVAMTDAAGAVAERYDYGDYGAPRIFDGNGAPLAVSAIGNPFLFRGWRFDDASGLYRNPMGDYEPASGRPASAMELPLLDMAVASGGPSRIVSGAGVTDPGGNPWTPATSSFCGPPTGPVDGGPSNSWLPNWEFVCAKGSVGNQFSRPCCDASCFLCAHFGNYPCCEGWRQACLRMGGRFYMAPFYFE